MKEGSKGVWNVNNRTGIRSHWEWYVVYKIDVGEWNGSKSNGNGNSGGADDGNDSTVDSGGGSGRTGGNSGESQSGTGGEG